MFSGAFREYTINISGVVNGTGAEQIQIGELCTEKDEFCAESDELHTKSDVNL